MMKTLKIASGAKGARNPLGFMIYVSVTQTTYFFPTKGLLGAAKLQTAQS